MPSISQCTEIAVAILRNAPEAVLYFTGKPGMGKSDMTGQIGDGLSIPRERQLMINMTHHDVVDFEGVPSVVDGMTKFNPSNLLYQFREGTGPGLIILEELPQSSNMHQTWAAGFMLDRQTTTFKLDPQVIVIGTGNRIEDKAGARMLLSHLKDRMYELEVESSIDDWSGWALEKGIDHLGVAFLRLRPELLNNFDPNNKTNATQRSWTKLFSEVPPTLPTNLYLFACEAKVGEGPAAEWVAARDMMSKMPSIDLVRMQPDKAEVPTEPAVMFALATALALSTEEGNFERTMTYMNRMKNEFQVLYMTDTLRMHESLRTTKTFIDWALKNKDIFMGND